MSWREGRPPQPQEHRAEERGRGGFWGWKKREKNGVIWGSHSPPRHNNNHVVSALILPPNHGGRCTFQPHGTDGAAGAPEG